MPWKWNERGVALGVVIMMSLVFAAVSMGALMLSSSRSQTSSLQAHRLKAQYAAEAGLVWAMQRLFTDPSQAFASGDTDVTMNGVDVDVILPACSSTPCETRPLQAKAVY